MNVKSSIRQRRMGGNIMKSPLKKTQKNTLRTSEYIRGGSSCSKMLIGLLLTVTVIHTSNIVYDSRNL